MTETANVKVRGLTRTFDDKTVIDGLDLTLRRGEFVALLGHSGCGKSTLLKILAGLDDETEGEVTVPERRSVAFQSPRLMPWLRVWRNVVLGLPGSPDRALAERYLAEVGIEEYAGRWPKTLSGGQAQRPAARPSASPWPALWCANPNCFFSTSRSAPWTPSRGAGHSGWWRISGSGTAARCCWSPTTWRRRCCWPTGSW